MLTIYVPTFNRESRLSQSLDLIFSEIVKYQLENEVSVLVGDNASTDNTSITCSTYKNRASQAGITFDYFRNSSNFGFGGNIEQGFLRVASGWILFLSDDDVLCSAILKSICRDLNQFSPDLAIYNFDGLGNGENPQIEDTQLITHALNKRDFRNIQHMILFPKLAGIVLRARLDTESEDFIHGLLSRSKSYPHVVLAILRFNRGKVLYKSKEFLAKPDEDHLEHVNFLWYTSEYLVEELIHAAQYLGITNLTLIKEIEALPRVNVLDSSVSHLLLYYLGRARITRSVKRTLWSNVLRYVTLRNRTRDGLKLRVESPRTLIKIIALIFVSMSSHFLLLLLGRSKKLMPEGF